MPAPVPATPAPAPAEQINPTVVSAVPDAGALAALESSLALDAAPPAETPAETPPAETPAAETAPAETPAAETPPGTPPGTPPAETPPGETPPAAEVPVADPNAPAAKPSDEFGELPKDVKAETRERFNQVKGKYDEAVAARDEAVQKVEKWHDIIASTGAPPEQFGVMLNFLKDVNSGSPDGLRRAYDAVTAQAAALGKLLGVPAANYDPLADHPDLLKRVEEDETLTREDALEIAKARAATSLQQTVSTQATAATQQQTEINNGLEKVRSVGVELRTANPVEFAAKFPFIQPMIDTVIASLPPARWEQAIREAYSRIPMPATAAPAPTPTPVPAPIRPGGAGPSGSGLLKQPGSALEAMEMALSRR